MQKEGTLVPLSRKFYPSLPESRCLGFGLSKGALDKTAGHLPGHSSMHCFPRPTMPLRPTAPGSQPLLALPIPCFLQAPCADMGSCTRAHCVAGALDFTRLLCAVLGIVVIMVVPSIIKLQVHKSVCVWTPVACPSAYGRRSLFPSTSLSTSLTCQPQGDSSGQEATVVGVHPYVWIGSSSIRATSPSMTMTQCLSSSTTTSNPSEKSSGLESYYIVKPNILVLSAALVMENMSMGLKLFMTLVFTTLVSVPSWTTL